MYANAHTYVCSRVCVCVCVSANANDERLYSQFTQVWKDLIENIEVNKYINMCVYK